MAVKVLIVLIYIICPIWLRAALPTYSAIDCKGYPLDYKLVQIMSKRDGFFIEVGAYDGIFSSNTKLLEDHFGWRGILIEPTPAFFETLVINRPCSKVFPCALGSFEQDNTFINGDFDQPHPMASIAGARLGRESNQRVLVRSLQSILDEMQVSHVDFFSLDTEGYELNILRGIDFSKVTFDYILIEIYLVEYQAIIDLLSTNGYGLVGCLSNYNHQDNPGWDGTHNDYLFKRM